MGKTRQTRRIIRLKRNSSKSIWLDRPHRKSAELTCAERTCDWRSQRLSLSTPLRNHRATGHHSGVVSPQPPLHTDSTARSPRDIGVFRTHLDAISSHALACHRLCDRPHRTLVSGRPAHWTNIQRGICHRDLCSMPGFIRTGSLHLRTAHKRNWHTQSNGRIRLEPRNTAVQRLYHTRRRSKSDRLADYLSGDGSMVAAFCLSD